MEAIGKLLDHLGYAAPLLYAGAAYGLFHWLDENLSDAARAALARTMNLRDYGKEQIATALVEVFDRIYTRPLLGWRAFVRSLLFTTVVSGIFLFEVFGPRDLESADIVVVDVEALAFNVFTDYVSLFVIRSLLTRTGTKAVVGLTLAATSGAAIVLLASAMRTVLLLSFIGPASQFLSLDLHSQYRVLFGVFSFGRRYMWPAIVVFAWLPLFALGISTIRALTPLSWIVAKAQWALKEGDQHPLRAIGCVAAVAVFAVTVGLRTIITA